MSATKIVLLPGSMCDGRLWHHLSLALRHGAVYADLTRDDSISGIAARTLAQTDGRLIPIGLSMGGIVTLEMARQAPDRIIAMVLSDTNAGADLPERAAVRPEQQRRVLNGELKTLISDELKPAYLADRHRKNQPLRDLILQMAVDLGPKVFVRQSEALRTRADLSGVLDTFTGPVLFLCGAEDRLCPPDWHHAMASRCADAAVEVIDGSGHLLPLEQPEAFSASVSNWLDHRRLRH